MSEVTSSIEEGLMRYRRPTSTLPHRMLWLTTLAGMIVLAVGEGTASEFNGTASESPVELNTTAAPPLREPVTDLFSAPIAAFKVQVPLSPQLTEGEEGDVPGLGKAENNTDSTPTPPFSNLWFNAGQSLGSAANSLTGWLNNRLVPQTTSTTTRPPEVIVRLQSNPGMRKPLISILDNKESQANRLRPVVDDDADDDDDDYDEDDADEEDYDDNYDEQPDDEDSNSNRYSSNNDDDDDEDGEAEDDEEEEEPVKKRKNSKKKPKRPTNHRRGYDYDEEDTEDYYDDDDDDEDYDYDQPKKDSARQQQQESFLNRFRQLAQRPYSTSNKQQSNENQANNPSYRPVRIVQNGQVLQLVQNHPSQQQQQQQQQLKRRRRPSSNQNTFQFIPIRNQQASTAGQKQKKKKITKPDPANQIVIPIPQSSQNGQQKPSQYITIPWSQLGIPTPQQDFSQSGQQAAPFIVNIPQQQNANRRRRPAQQQQQPQPTSTPQRKRLRRPLKTRPQNSQIVSLLTDQSIREIFRVPEIPPSRTPQEDSLVGGKRKRPVQTEETDNATTIGVAATPETESNVEEDGNESEDDQQQFIVVGDDDTADEVMARQVTPNRYLHIGGMKPYVDVLNKGRIYLKTGRQLRMDFDERPESKITSISPERAIAVDITTDSSSETKVNAPPTILHLESEDSSTTGNPMPQ